MSTNAEVNTSFKIIPWQYDYSKIKAIITDVDGVLTDGGMYYDVKGLAFKRFHVRDGSAIHRLKKHGYKIFALTISEDELTLNRLRVMNFDWIMSGVSDKASCVKLLADERGLELSEICYIGDDYWDIVAMELVGLSIAPNDALQSVKKIAHHIAPINGGDGILAYITDMLISGD